MVRATVQNARSGPKSSSRTRELLQGFASSRGAPLLAPASEAGRQSLEKERGSALPPGRDAVTPPALRPRWQTERQNAGLGPGHPRHPGGRTTRPSAAGSLGGPGVRSWEPTGGRGAEHGCGAERPWRRGVTGVTMTEAGKRPERGRRFHPWIRSLKSGDFAGAGPEDRPERAQERTPGSLNSGGPCFPATASGQWRGRKESRLSRREQEPPAAGCPLSPVMLPSQRRQCHSPPLPGEERLSLL